MTLALNPGIKEPDDPIRTSKWPVVVASGDDSVIPKLFVSFALEKRNSSPHTIALSNAPFRIPLQQVLRELTPQWRRTAKHPPHAAQVVLITFRLVVEYLNKYGRHDVELVDFEALHCSQEGVQLKVGQNDDLVTTVLTEQSDYGEAVDVAEREETKRDLGIIAISLSSDVLVDSDLHDVGYHVPVGDHNGFLIGGQFSIPIQRLCNLLEAQMSHLSSKDKPLAVLPVP